MKTYIVTGITELGKVQIPLKNPNLTNLQFPFKIIIDSAENFDIAEDNPSRKTFELDWFEYQETE